MKRFTKYDVIDILLVYCCIAYIPYIFVMLFMQISMMSQHVRGGIFQNPDLFGVVLFQLFYILGIAVLLYVALFKRNVIIRKFFPESDQKEVLVSDGLEVLTHYSFWVRLVGVLMILRFATNLITGVSGELARSQIEQRAFMLQVSGTEFLSGVLLGFLILWKADWIAATLTKIGANTASYSAPEIAADNIDDENVSEGDAEDTETDR